MFKEIITERQKALGIDTDIDVARFQDVNALYDDVIQRFGPRQAFTSLRHTLTYQELGRLADAFAWYLQNHTPLKPGDRIAIQLPNIIQQPVVVLGAFRAGLVVVNTNPLYTERELEHQFNDAGAKALVVVANMAHTVQKVLAKTGVEHVIITELADLHPTPKRQLLNFAVKHVKKMVPAYHIPKAVALNDALGLGRGKQPQRVTPRADDIAILQYTGGTTGVSKGAMLTHANIVANAIQSSAIFDTYGLVDDGSAYIQPLPLYHVYALIVSYIVMMQGGHTVLIPNPRDLPGLVKEMTRWRVQGFFGLNTLFVALCNNAAFKALDFSHLKLTLSGGMALTRFAAEEWKKVTGCDVYEGYGLTETSPVVAVNPGNGNRIGYIGVPVPHTEIDIRDDAGNSVGTNTPGELCIKGPQVMKGYWQRDDETAKCIRDGWFASGDVAIITDDGYLKIVDRKKEMIIVSGFNVYPNEVENVVVSHKDILEAAAIGLPDDKTGEAVHVYCIRTPDAHVTEQALIEYCRKDLAAYKVPRRVVFCTELPKSNVGKILRREVKAMAEREAGIRK